MIDTFTIAASRLSASERASILDRLTWPGSDFHAALEARKQGGTICLALHRGDIVGWARTEGWNNWPTLESFVADEWRGLGVATYCAAGLVASGLFRASDRYCAVFSRPMLAVAGKVGLSPILFTKAAAGWTVDWRRP